ncbi:hypothetical protein [Streptacidiphilus rugosus]|uniref:hypothetical protein n=1 Tax=Streptacidiphilus rugosus TaxID=405783 RepID=UPI0006900680|nr:hypothetical protein [Streptacidiphilus rugosus]
MSFDPRYQAAPPGVMPPPPAGAPGRPGGVGAVIAGVGALGLLLLELVLLIATVAVASDHLGVFANLVGFGEHFIDAPIQFGAWDVALCGVLLAGAIGVFGGRDWGRPTILAGAVLITYPDTTQVLMQLTGSDASYFSRGHNLYFNLIMIAEILVGVATIVAVAVTSLSARKPGTPAPFGAGPVPPGAMPAPGRPVPGAPVQPTPAQPMPPQPFPHQQPVAGYPQHPAPAPGQPGGFQQPPPPRDPVAQQPTQSAPGVPPQAAPPQQFQQPQPPGYPPTAPGA